MREGAQGMREGAREMRAAPSGCATAATDPTRKGWLGRMAGAAASAIFVCAPRGSAAW